MILRAAVSAAPTAGTPPVLQDVKVATGPGSSLTPKATLYRATAGTALGTEVNAYRALLGMSDSTTNRALGAMAENGSAVGVNDCRTRIANAHVIDAPLGASGAVNGLAAFSSFGSGGSTVSWSDLLNAASLITSLDWYGDDIDVKVVEFTHTGTQDSTQDVPDLGFSPDLAVFYSHWSAYAADSDTADGRVGIGYAVKTLAGAIEQFCISDQNQDRSPLLWKGSTRLCDNRVAYRADEATDGAGLELTLWNGNTPRFTKRDAAENISTAILFIHFRTQVALRAVVLPTTDPGGGAPWLDTSTTGNKTITLGMTPAAYGVVGTMLATVNSTQRSNATRSVISDGWWTGTESVVVSLQAGDTNLGGTSSATRSVTSSKLVDLLKPVAGGTLVRDWELSHVNVGAAGPVVNVDTASVAARLSAIIAIGQPIRAIAETEQISDGAVLKIRNILPVGETETILESHTLAVTNRLPTSDTEQVSDQFSFLQADRRVISETEQISDAFSRIVGEHRPFNDTEQITDSPRLVLNRHTDFSETERISDASVLKLQTPGALVGTDTEQISDAAQLTLGYFIKTSDTEQISDSPAFKLATNITSFGETERISDAVTLRLGRVLVTSDTEQISDGFSSGRGLIARKSIRRGKVF